MKLQLLMCLLIAPLTAGEAQQTDLATLLTSSANLMTAGSEKPDVLHSHLLVGESVRIADIGATEPEEGITTAIKIAMESKMIAPNFNQLSELILQRVVETGNKVVGGME